MINTFRLNKQNPELVNSNSGPCYLILSRKSRIFFFDQTHHFQKCFVGLSCRVFQSPILPVGAWKVRTLHIAAHGDNYVHHRELGEKLAVLTGFHIDAMDFLHQPNGIWVDPRFRLRPGGIALKNVSRQLFPQRFGDLAAAGIMNTDKGYFFHSFSPALSLQIS